MNILYLIGNGFDLAQGLKTRYKDFYVEYKSSVDTNDVERQLISSINDQPDTWSDLEYALGQFTGKIDDAVSFADAYESLSLKLGDYLMTQESLFKSNNSQRFRTDLADPFQYLSYAEQVSFYEFASVYKKEAVVNVVSFNYTNIFEKAIDYQYTPIELKSPAFSNGIQLNNVFKVHGSLNGTILMGVNDVSQIANEAFSNNKMICDFMVKPRLNASMGFFYDQFALREIDSADLIIVYGMSIGLTDKLWWQRVAKRLETSSARMLIFYHLEHPINNRIKWKESWKKREVYNKLEDIAEIPEYIRPKIESRITVSLSDHLFNPNFVRYNPAH